MAEDPKEKTDDPAEIAGNTTPSANTPPQEAPVVLPPASTLPNIPFLEKPRAPSASSPIPEGPPLRTSSIPLVSIPIPEKKLVSQNFQGEAAVPFSKREEQKPTETPLERSIKEMGLAPEKKSASESPPKEAAFLSEAPEGLPRIRTYAGDMGEEIKKRGETLTTIVGAERERVAAKAGAGVATSTPKRNWRMIGTAVGIVVLVGGGIGAIIAATLFTRNAPEPMVLTSLIPANSKESLELLEKETLPEVLGRVRENESLTLGNILWLIPEKNGVVLSASEVMAELGAPAALVRNAKNSMVGIHSFNHNQPFVIVTISSYDLAFGAILSWEKSMGMSLGPFFAPPGSLQSPADRPPETVFSDHVYRNLDTRQSQEGWPMLYTFPRRDLLIMTTNENTLQEILTRLTVSETPR